jgi:parallel beta-helix repeat protein
MRKILLVFSIIILVGGLPLPTLVNASPPGVDARLSLKALRFEVVGEPSSIPSTAGSGLRSSGLIFHDPIAIAGDVDFASQATAEGWSGSGTAGDPYILEGYFIRVPDDGQHGFCINDSRVHFIIRNCSIDGTSYMYDAGIYFDNVTGGQIEDIRFDDNNRDIWLNDSHGIRITGCAFASWDQSDGVDLKGCNDCIISGNDFAHYLDDGIDNNYSNGTIISDNTFTIQNLYGDGIAIDDSEDIQVINNTFFRDNDYGSDEYLDVSDSENIYVANNTFEYGDEAVWFERVTNGTVDGCTFTACISGVYIEDSNGTTILQSTFDTCENGIRSEGANNTLSSGNTFSFCDSGINTISDNLSCINNTFFGNGYGLDWWGGLGGLVTNNTFSTNYRAIDLDDSHNNTVVTWNCFDSNIYLNVLDDGENNLFDYNYYSNYTGADVNSDGIGDTPHPLEGLAGNQDDHPLYYCPRAPVWVPPLADQVLIFGARLSYTVIPQSPAPLDPASFWINDTTNFAISGNSSSITITDTVALAMGTYTVMVRVSTIYGVPLVGTFMVTVLAPDTTPILLLIAAVVLIVVILIIVVAYLMYRRRKK